MKTAKHIGVKLEQSQLDMLEELQKILQAKNPVSTVNRTDVIKFAILTLYKAEKNSKTTYTQSIEQRYGVK